MGINKEDYYNINMDKELKIRKGQKCWLCKKEINGIWCYNGHWWHEKCKDKDTKKRISEYINQLK